MLSNFLIALREGLEASLIVGILVAYVVKTNRRHLLPPLWSGVGVALAISFALGGFLAFLALAAAAFFAVAREGLETALFVYSNFQVAGSKIPATIGLVSGLLLSVLLGYAIYRRAIKFNLSKFFTITGVALIVVAAGVLSYGIHEFQELGWLPGEESYAWDVTSWMAADSIMGSLLAGTIGFDTTMSWLQLLAYSAYILGTLYLYLRPAKNLTTVKQS